MYASESHCANHTVVMAHLGLDGPLNNQTRSFGGDNLDNCLGNQFCGDLQGAQVCISHCKQLANGFFINNQLKFYSLLATVHMGGFIQSDHIARIF